MLQLLKLIIENIKCQNFGQNIPMLRYLNLFDVELDPDPVQSFPLYVCHHALDVIP